MNGCSRRKTRQVLILKNGNLDRRSTVVCCGHMVRKSSLRLVECVAESTHKSFIRISANMFLVSFGARKPA